MNLIFCIVEGILFYIDEKPEIMNKPRENQRIQSVRYEIIFTLFQFRFVKNIYRKKKKYRSLQGILTEDSIQDKGVIIIMC